MSICRLRCYKRGQPGVIDVALRNRWLRRPGARELLLASSALVALASPVAAQDATWTGANSASYDDPLNWDTGSVPSSTGTAFFGTSTVSTIAIHHAQVVGGWTFNAGASNYANALPVNPATDSVAFNGAGIVINGGSLLLTALSLQFNNNSSAGSATLTKNGISNFFDSSTAAS